jgi:prophage tail gpP-like protein
LSITPERSALRIGGVDVREWTEIVVHRQIDSYSTVALSAPFEPERRRFRDLFRPLSFASAELDVGDEILFRGTVMEVDPQVSPDERSVQVTCYSAPAVLEDVMMPASAFPLELNGLTLPQIAERLASPFGIQVESESAPGPSFARVAIKPDETVHSFLVGLARQRSRLLSDAPSGALRIGQPSASEPVARLEEGAPPLVTVRPSFAPRRYFSEITGLRRSQAGRLGARHTATNPRLDGVVRSHSFQVEQADRGDLPQAVAAKLGRMFAESVSYTLTMPGARTPAGDLWAPGMTLLLTAPSAMIYRPTRLVVREATLRQSAESTTTELAVVLPGTFSGEIPAELPWE